MPARKPLLCEIELCSLCGYYHTDCQVSCYFFIWIMGSHSGILCWSYINRGKLYVYYYIKRNQKKKKKSVARRMNEIQLLIRIVEEFEARIAHLRDIKISGFLISPRSCCLSSYRIFFVVSVIPKRILYHLMKLDKCSSTSDHVVLLDKVRPTNEIEQSKITTDQLTRFDETELLVTSWWLWTKWDY